MTSTWARLSAPIETVSDADALIADLGKGLYVIAALQAVVGAIIASKAGYGFLGDVAFCLVAGYLLPRSRSRVLSAAVFLWATLGLWATIAARFGDASGGRNVILAVLVLAFAARGVQATIRYHKVTGSKPHWRNVAIVTALHMSAALAVFVTCVLLILVGHALGVELSDEAAGMWFMAGFGISALVIYVAARRWFPLLAAPAALDAIPDRPVDIFARGVGGDPV